MLLTGANSKYISKLQRLQNWCAKLIFCATKRDHASQYLQSLHWLPVRQRILYKMFLYVFKCLHGLAPTYLSSSIPPYKQNRPGLRSELDVSRLHVPKYNYKGLKSAFEKSFSLSVPSIWNSLPLDLRSASSIQTFKRKLKTHLFPV